MWRRLLLAPRINSRGLIAAAVQDARNEDVARLGAVVDDVVSDGKAAKACGDLVAPPTSLGMIGQQDASIRDVVDQTIGYLDAVISSRE